jgi:hypothetical protein
MENEITQQEQINRLLVDVMILKAKEKTLNGLVLFLLKEKHPDEFEKYFKIYESLLQKNANSIMVEMPEYQAALLRKIQDELGI